MSDNLENVGYPIFVEGTTTGECIVLNDLEDNEEEIIFINSDKCSSACQTEPWCSEPVDYPYIPNIPIFFSAQLSPDLATTQCFIPILVDVAVGTDSSQPCFKSGYKEWNHPDNLGTGSISTDQTENVSIDIDFKAENSPAFTKDIDSTEAVLTTKVEGVRSPQNPVDCNIISEILNSEAPCESSVPDPDVPDTVQVKKKRGRKKKLVCATSEETIKIQSTFNSQTKQCDTKLGKRRRKAKRYTDYEYDLCDSEDELKVKFELEDDDRDEDYKDEKENFFSEDDEEKFSSCITHFKNKQVYPIVTFSENVKIEAENEEHAPMDDVTEEYDDMSEEYDECEVDSDEGGECDNLPSSQEGNNKVLKVGINDLDPENDHSKRLNKYLTKAKEKYHREKIVKDDGKVMYRCLKCKEEFKMRLQLKEHKKIHNTKVRIYDCSHCDKVFTEARKYYSHLGFHDRLFECRSCGRRFSLLGNLKKHLTIHQGAPNQVCEVCGNQFLTTEELKLHHETQHNEDSIRAYKIECKHCGRKYVREEAYYQHINKAPYKCSMCDESLGCEFKLKDHIRYQHGRCVCEFCGKSFKKRSLIHHIKIVHREACVQCPQCPKKFAYRSKMLAHVDANHTEEKKYKCNQCNYTARTVNTLNLHRRRYHSEPGSLPQYGCDLCGRKFYLPSKLTLHYRVHTGEKPYSCGSCGKTFASKYNMVEHERCVHGERVKLVHPDGSSSVSVVKHRRSPRAPGRRCELCGINLPSSSAMVAHMKQHHNAQALPTISLVADNDGAKVESQVTEIELNRENYETPGEQYEVIENAEQDLILTASSGMVTIPEYATHVEIDGVEYQVLRQ